MATIGNLIRKERIRRGLNQSEFGQLVNLIMTDISKIENNKKKFPFDKLKNLTDVLEKNYEELKNLYVAEKIAEEAFKYRCTEDVFQLAEEHSIYLKTKNSKQGELNYE